MFTAHTKTKGHKDSKDKTKSIKNPPPVKQPKVKEVKQ